jgi:hypothetical protein
MKKTYLSCILLLSIVSGYSQARPNVFVNCATTETRCFRDYLYQTISNCNFVWDAAIADVQVLVSEKPSAAGGMLLTLEFTGMNTLKGKSDTLTQEIPQGATDEFIRTHICTTIQQGLQYVFHHSPWHKLFDAQMAVLEKGSDTIETKPKDPWNHWNFTPGINGYFEGQSNSFFLEFNKELTVLRITNENKFILNAQQGTKYTSYTLEGEKISININKFNAIPLYVKSINDHWSAGITGQYQMDEYKNIKNSYRVAPVIEYNIFPYSINAQKQLRLAYQAGVNYFEYFDTTIYDKENETRAYNRLAIITDVTRNWGSIRSSIQGNAYFDDWSQNRITFTTFLSLRIAKGLSFTIDGKFEIVNDQISLLKNPLADNVYLLGGQQLATKNYYSAEFGLIYTFGSIFSSTVNPRMGQIDEIDF